MNSGVAWILGVLLMGVSQLFTGWVNGCNWHEADIQSLTTNLLSGTIRAIRSAHPVNATKAYKQELFKDQYCTLHAHVRVTIDVLDRHAGAHASFVTLPH